MLKGTFRSGILVTGGLLVAFLAQAQPAPGTSGAVSSPPQKVDEEAPPVVVAAPAPVLAPAVPATEVAPAIPPEKQVVQKPVESTEGRPRFNRAVLQALDKVTAETFKFEVPVGSPIRYKTLVVTVKACEHSAADEPEEDSVAYLKVDSQPKAVPGKPALPSRQVFRGWMYASSPAINPLQHPVYDIWLISCRTDAPLRPAVP